ncbi:hypothetical protein CVO76_14620 [Arthrobacter agilis]|uniref:Glycosyl transferase family 1 domain-containing protein n=1 Tax=Arthrobacter agilis TaxID=37921 RepID=A0A2L0UHM6_9MICC|nr:glycosyltransferase [Arthrobacter agilis]AUZ88739.1 hypothetical protein CVO76_14620 [Arthrobacter agilis]
MSEAADGVHTATVLPAGRHFAVTWSLPAEFAGRTNAMLHRSRAFAKYGGHPVDILTFDSFRDYPTIRRVLTERGFLNEGTRVLNMWEDLPAVAEAVNERGGDATVYEHFAPLSTRSSIVVERLEGPHPRLARYAEDGKTLLQMDHFRPDGTLLLSDRHDAKREGFHGGRVLTLCDSRERPVRRWTSAWGLYRAWIEYLTSTDPAWFVVDNKDTARFMASVERDNALVLYQIHESHLASPSGSFAAELTQSATEVLPRLDRLDGVIFLTEQQERDVHLRQADVGNSYVVPNSREIGGTDPGVARNPRRGMQAASLNHRKRIDHAIRAVHQANERLSEPVTLDVFGGGSQLEALNELITSLGSDSTVSLKGHVTSAQQFFSSASFSLLTSTSEALPLALLESMAAGCIPITYDIRYGPASVITHGVNGFIVEQGNVDALAKCIEELVTMPKARLAELRAAARARAMEYSDANVVQKWADTMRDAVNRKRMPSPPVEVRIVDSSCTFRAAGSLEIELEVQTKVESKPLDSYLPAFYCSMKIRSREAFFRVASSKREERADGSISLMFVFPVEMMQALKECTADLMLETRYMKTTVVTRVPLAGLSGTATAYSTTLGNLSISFQ